MTISVIIPTRNEEKLLRGCLEQFPVEFKQEFGIEIIVSDGGSSDATFAIASGYADRIVTHNDSSHRQTIGEGRNRGAAIASGDIFVFLNADTRIPDIANFFERIRNRMSSNLSIVAVSGKVKVLPEERTLTDVIFHAYFNNYIQLINFIGIGMGRGECQIIRSSAFNELEGYNESLAAGEDFELFNRLKKTGKVLFDTKLLVYESPRRYRKFGYSKVYFDWVKNGFSVIFKKRSSSEIWEEVR